MYNSKPVRDISWEEGLYDDLQLQKFSSLTTADHTFHPVEYFIISSSTIFVSPYSTLDEFHLVTIFCICATRQNPSCGETLTNRDRIHRAEKRSQSPAKSTARVHVTLTNPDRIHRAEKIKRSQPNPLCNQRSQIPTESKI
jgi:hypothetical protein